MIHWRVLIVLLTVFCFSSISLASSNPNIINFHQTQYNASNKNWSITKDNLGVVYFGNDIGLLEFDGVGWYLNKLENTKAVKAVLATSNKTIFSGGYEEFGRWDRGIDGKLAYTSLSSNLPKGALHNDDIWKIWEVSEKIYFQSFRSIYVYDQKTVTELSLNRNILFLSKVYDQLWVQEMGGSLFRIEKNRLKEIPGSNIFSKTEVRVILPYKGGSYLIGTSSMGLFIYDGQKISLLTDSHELTTTELNCGILATNGNYYLGTILNGVYVMSADGTILNHFNADFNMQNNTVLSLLEDGIGNIWVGLDRGITYIQYLKNMSSFTDPTGKTGAVYTAALYAGKLFIGTNQGLFYTDNPSLKNARLSDLKLVAGTQGQVWTLNVIDNKLYCGHNKGLMIIDASLHTSSPYAVNTGVFHISDMKDNWLMLGTYTSSKSLNLKAGIVNDLNQVSELIINIEKDHLDNIWLEHANKGVYKCRLSKSRDKIESYKYYGANNNLPYKLHLFKVGGRAVFLGNDKFYTYNDIEDKIVLDKVLNDRFKQVNGLTKVVAIDQYHFWVLGNNLIYKLYYNGQTARIEDKLNIGFANLSLVEGYENIVTLNDSTSLICLDNGFLLYNKKDSKYAFSLTSPYFISVEAQNAKGENLFKDFSTITKISYNFNTLTVKFSSKDIFMSNLAFQYKLDGIDLDWSKPDRLNEITYARLPEGTYTLRVRSVDYLGNQSEEITYQFIIQSPWYSSVWAWMVYIILVISICYLIWQMMLKHYRNVYLRKIRYRENIRLSRSNESLKNQVEEKNAELFSQTSFIIQKNELILKVKNEIDNFYNKQNNKALAPLYQKINVLLTDNLDAETDWKMFLIKFEQKHDGFFKKLKELYPQLTVNDLKLCACLKLNLDSKEIASLMSISVRAVENSRYRIRKKLDIPTSQNLNDFFLNI